MEYQNNEREYLNDFLSYDSAEKVWNSIREKELQKDITHDSNANNEPSLNDNHHCKMISDHCDINCNKSIMNPTNDQSNVLKVLIYCVEINFNEQF